MIPTVSTANVEEMEPADRLAHWKAENERLKFEVDTQQLIPAEDVAREFSLMAKAVVMCLKHSRTFLSATVRLRQLRCHVCKRD
jgi:hypothetical protein